MISESQEYSTGLVAVAAMLALIVPLGSFHVWSFKRRVRRGVYLLVLLPLLVAFALVPVIVGDPKFGLIQVWWAYMVIFSPGFYETDGLLALYFMCYGLAVAHNVLSVLIASWIAKRKEPIQQPQQQRP